MMCVTFFQHYFLAHLSGWITLIYFASERKYHNNFVSLRKHHNVLWQLKKFSNANMTFPIKIITRNLYCGPTYRCPQHILAFYHIHNIL